MIQDEPLAPACARARPAKRPGAPTARASTTTAAAAAAESAAIPTTRRAAPRPVRASAGGSASTSRADVAEVEAQLALPHRDEDGARLRRGRRDPRLAARALRRRWSTTACARSVGARLRRRATTSATEATSHPSAGSRRIDLSDDDVATAQAQIEARIEARSLTTTSAPTRSARSLIGPFSVRDRRSRARVARRHGRSRAPAATRRQLRETEARDRRDARRAPRGEEGRTTRPPTAIRDEPMDKRGVYRQRPREGVVGRAGRRRRGPRRSTTRAARRGRR